jgi:thiamine biosynthesis lipoprotein
MGTLLNVSLCKTSREHDNATFDYIFNKIRLVENVISEWKSSSELSLLQSSSPGKIKIGSLLYEFLTFAKQVSKLSAGDVDITVGRYTRTLDREKHDLTNYLASMQGLHLLNNQEVMFKRRPVFDTGAIGKGFALDFVGEGLKERGVKCALLDFGGSSILAIAAPPNQDGWHVRDAMGGEVTLNNVAVGVSETYLYYEDGKKKAHIMDLRSGELVNKKRVVTVYAKSAALADALSTWGIIRGPERVLKNRQKLRMLGLISINGQ